MSTRKQRKRIHHRRVAASQPRVRECLFCRSTTNRFSTVEHIVSESMVGDSEKVLRKAVCTPCNHGVLSNLDDELGKFLPIAFMRTVFGIPNKRGKIPPTRAANALIEARPSALEKLQPHQHVHVNAQSERVWQDTEGGFKLGLEGRRMTRKYVSTLVRALYKITLELIYLDHGRKFALDPRFDDIREIVLGKRDFHGYLMIGNRAPSRHLPKRDSPTSS